MITLQNIDKTYGQGEGSVQALSGVSFQVEKGDFIKVTGPSGSGKSTLLNVMAGLLHPDKGEIIIDGISIYEELDTNGLARFRREYLGFIFQAFNLFPYLTSLENVLLPLAPVNIPGNQKRSLAEEALKKVGLWDRKSHKPGELSGGQQQRVAVARALVNEPYILLADEPTGNLDSNTRDDVLSLFSDLNKTGHTIVLVSHDESVRHGQNKIFNLRDGKLQ